MSSTGNDPKTIELKIPQENKEECLKSAKSFDFTNKGEESTIDFKRIIDIVNRFEYDGYYGIEYEGLNMSEEKGILKTKKLLERHL